MANEQIHTLIAVGHDGKIFSLRTNCGKKADEDIIREYDRGMDAKLPQEKICEIWLNIMVGSIKKYEQYFYFG